MSQSRSTTWQMERAPWARTWALAALLFVLGLLALELLWRSAGFRPSVVDDEDLWAQERSSVYARGDDRVVVLLGSSRMQLDVDLEVLREELPGYRPVQLALSGRHALAALRDLASDPDFTGTVVVEATARTFLPKDRFGQQSYVDHFRRRWWLPRRVERSVATGLQSRLATVQASTNLLERIARWIDGRGAPRPPYTSMTADRAVAARYGDSDLERVREGREQGVRGFYEKAKLPEPRDWLALARETDPWVRAIQERGGRVAFVRVPTTGLSWELDERYLPRAEYWDAFAASTPATTIHFRDVPEMRSLDCPDTSHLDVSDTPTFTRSLARELRARGVVS